MRVVSKATRRSPHDPADLKEQVKRQDRDVGGPLFYLRNLALVHATDQASKGLR